MRLTLRTMLAYLDSVLEPADAEVLGKKIEESEFASGLVERVRSVSKKLRMDAPKIDGKGMGNDANSVAEYLDSTLPQDRVGDFERICLESDRHLAEVAGCHQVLTLVLGKPAEVPEGLRERIYALANPELTPKGAGRAVTAAPAATNGKAVAATAVPTTAPAAPEVPDYLRAGQRSSVWPLVAALAAAFLIGAVGLRLLGPFDGSHPVMRMLGGTPTVAVATPETPAVVEEPSTPTPAVAAADAATPPGPPPETVVVEEPAAETPEPAVVAVDPTIERPKPPVVVEEFAEPAPSDPEAPAPASEPMPEAVPPEPMPPVVAAAPPIAAGEVGRYISDEQVLASFDESLGAWRMKPARDLLVAGERLVALPTYRPQLAFPSGVQVTFAGESAVRMEAPGESGASRMSVAMGKFVVVSVGAAGAQIDLSLGDLQGVATLVDADSILAVKVSRWLPPGSDPQMDPGLTVAELFTTNGRVSWQEPGQDKVDIPAGFVRVYAGGEPPETLGPFETPQWIDAKSIAPIDRRAGPLLYSLLEPAKPLNVSLHEKLTDRRLEVRNLSSRCLAALDEFEPLLKDLSNPEMASFWFGEIDALRSAIQRGPAVAAHLESTIAGLRGDEANVIYRLLWGFSQEQLEKGSTIQLVKHLESDQMDVRVLTFYNLYAITGAQEFYRPEKRPDQQKGALANWKERQEKGTIAYKFPPSPLENYKPLEKPPATSGARLPLEPEKGERL